jgi:hypothetical protein
MTQEVINDNDYNECIRCFEYVNSCESRNEPITSLSIITSSNKAKLPLSRNENSYQIIWNDLGNLLKPYQDLTPRHKTLWHLVNRFKIEPQKKEEQNKAESQVKEEDTVVNNRNAGATKKKSLDNQPNYEM